MTESQNDLQRFFRQLVRNLAATDPARLHRPLPLADIRGAIIPYRANRRALQLESAEDYELVLLQLCAGEGGFALIEPGDVRDSFAAELRSANPDLGILDRHENAIVSLQAGLLAEALDSKPDRAFAPPALVDDSLDFEVSAAPEPSPVEAAPRCTGCGGLLPAGRVVSFCPHCGRRQADHRCPECASEVEAGWRHCVSCGTHLSAS